MSRVIYECRDCGSKCRFEDEAVANTDWIADHCPWSGKACRWRKVATLEGDE